MFPEDVAFPIYVGEGKDKPYKLLLEMHYDRTPPGGIVDSSGMEFFYTHQKPRHLAGTLSVSVGVVPVLIVPPKAEKFSYTTTCSSSCTDKVPHVINITDVVWYYYVFYRYWVTIIHCVAPGPTAHS